MTQAVEADGARIPAVGFGTWRLAGEEAVRAVATALRAGYRHIDTAAMYGNEVEVGEAIRSHGAPRDDVFLTTKVWSSDVADGKLQRSAEASLKRLGMDQVDLLLIHWPSRQVPFAEQIRALCGARKRGLAKHIGVSNFPPRFVEAAVAIADEPIVTNQVEYHPYLDQSALFAVCRQHGISITAYAPLGRGALMQDPVITALAEKHRKSPAQIVLRWHVQQPMTIAIPKSSNPQRIAENIDIFDFELTPEEMQRIHALVRPDGRMVHGSYPSDWTGAPEN
jgi:diketogulonate reductase-like aldo/keto reductase